MLELRMLSGPAFLWFKPSYDMVVLVLTCLIHLSEES